MKIYKNYIKVPTSMITVLQACHRNNIYHMVFRAPFLQNYELNIVFYEASRLLLFNSPFLCSKPPRGRGLGGVAPPGATRKGRSTAWAPRPRCCLRAAGLGENVDKRQGEKLKSGCIIYVISNAMFSYMLSWCSLYVEYLHHDVWYQYKYVMYDYNWLRIWLRSWEVQKT